jgi:hypothetical protein
MEGLPEHIVVLVTSAPRFKALYYVWKNRRARISAITEHAKTNNTTMKMHLEVILDYGIFIEKGLGRMRWYEWNEENGYAQILQAIFKEIERNGAHQSPPKSFDMQS